MTKGFFGELTEEIISKQVQDYARDTVKYFFRGGVHEMQNLMFIMETNEGRNKIFGLFQYLINLYVKCMTSSSD